MCILHAYHLPLLSVFVKFILFAPNNNAHINSSVFRSFFYLFGFLELSIFCIFILPRNYSSVNSLTLTFFQYVFTSHCVASSIRCCIYRYKNGQKISSEGTELKFYANTCSRAQKIRSIYVKFHVRAKGENKKTKLAFCFHEIFSSHHRISSTTTWKHFLLFRYFPTFMIFIFTLELNLWVLTNHSHFPLTSS